MSNDNSRTPWQSTWRPMVVSVVSSLLVVTVVGVLAFYKESIALHGRIDNVESRLKHFEVHEGDVHKDIEVIRTQIGNRYTLEDAREDLKWIVNYLNQRSPTNNPLPPSLAAGSQSHTVLRPDYTTAELSMQLRELQNEIRQLRAQLSENSRSAADAATSQQNGQNGPSESKSNDDPQ